MNDRTNALRVLLKRRGLDIRGLAKAAAVNYTHFCQVLAGTASGRQTWKRIRIVASEEEQREIVRLYGPVFDEDSVDVLALD